MKHKKESFNMEHEDFTESTIYLINNDNDKSLHIAKLIPSISNPRQFEHEAFWELTGFRFHRNSKVKRVMHESTPMMGDPLGSSRVSFQKQNREGVVGAQSGQYCATTVE
ncbi:hypothetical protein DVH24_033592 [Malus domestica]|uniref:Uncharacterized protein n=1 Tax=Malus domestica TaxID=3750 RepID=A0A498JC32_MALDO|nr:hypothetical protein DVH24_033592 [Malus domestica]